MGHELLGLQEMPLRVLHADRRVDRLGESEVGHVADDQLAPVALGREPFAEELDVARRQVEARHDVAAVGEPHQVGAGAAGDVDDPADAVAREAPEAVHEEVDLTLAVEVERDLVEARGAVFAGPALLAKPQRSSPTTPGAPHGSPTRRRCRSGRKDPSVSDLHEVTADDPAAFQHPHDLDQLRHSEPAGLGRARPGASAGSRTSMSIVT